MPDGDKVVIEQTFVTHYKSTFMHSKWWVLVTELRGAYICTQTSCYFNAR